MACPMKAIKSFADISFKRWLIQHWLCKKIVELLAIILFVPGLHGLFSVTTLAMPQIAMIVVLAILPTICIQIIKMWQERR